MSNSSPLPPIPMSWPRDCVNDNLSGKRDFEDVINLKIMGRSPGIIWVDPKCNHKCPYKRVAEDDLNAVGEKGKCGHRMRLRTHNTIYRWCVTAVYTWNLCNFINQCCPNKFNNFFKKKRLKWWSQKPGTRSRCQPLNVEDDRMGLAPGASRRNSPADILMLALLDSLWTSDLQNYEDKFVLL